MKKGKRSNGEGTIRQLPDGRWEARFMIGRGNDGRPKYKYLSAKTQRELRSRIKAWQEDVSQGIENMKIKQFDCGHGIHTEKANQFVEAIISI